MEWIAPIPIVIGRGEILSMLADISREEQKKVGAHQRFTFLFAVRDK